MAPTTNEMDQSTSSNALDLSSFQLSSPSAERPEPPDSRSKKDDPLLSDNVWELPLELDYDDSRISEEERQLIADAYAGIDVNARDYVTRVPQKDPKIATSSKEGATRNGPNAELYSQN